MLRGQESDAVATVATTRAVKRLLIGWLWVTRHGDLIFRDGRNGFRTRAVTRIWFINCSTMYWMVTPETPNRQFTGIVRHMMALIDKTNEGGLRIEFNIRPWLDHDMDMACIASTITLWQFVIVWSMDEEEHIKVSDYRYVLAKHNILGPSIIMPYCPQQVSEAKAMFTFNIVITSLTHCDWWHSPWQLDRSDSCHDSCSVSVSYSMYVIIINWLLS